MSDDSTDEDRRHLVRPADQQSGRGGVAGNRQLCNLSEKTGLQRLGMLQGRLDSGDGPCRLPTSGRKEIFLQIITGTGELECDGQRVSLATGDLLSLSHPEREPTLHNRGDEPLLWFFGSL